MAVVDTSLPGQMPTLSPRGSMGIVVENVEGSSEQHESSLKNAAAHVVAAHRIQHSRVITGRNLALNLSERAKRASAFRGIFLGLSMMLFYYLVLKHHFRINEIAEVQSGIEQIILEQKGDSDIAWGDIATVDDYYDWMKEVYLPLLWGGDTCGPSVVRVEGDREIQPYKYDAATGLGCQQDPCMWGCTRGTEFANFDEDAELDDGSCYKSEQPASPSGSPSPSPAAAPTGRRRRRQLQQEAGDQPPGAGSREPPGASSSKKQAKEFANYNKILGGILITQHRSQNSECLGTPTGDLSGNLFDPGAVDARSLLRLRFSPPLLSQTRSRPQSPPLVLFLYSAPSSPFPG